MLRPKQTRDRDRDKTPQIRAGEPTQCQMSLQENGKRDTNRKRTRLSPPPMHVTLALEAHDCLHSSHCPTESFVRVAGAAVSTNARAAVVCLASGMGARRAAPGAAIAMAATHDAIATNSSQRRTKHSQTKPATTTKDEEEES